MPNARTPAEPSPPLHPPAAAMPIGSEQFAERAYVYASEHVDPRLRPFLRIAQLPRRRCYDDGVSDWQNSRHVRVPGYPANVFWEFPNGVTDYYSEMGEPIERPIDGASHFRLIDILDLLQREGLRDFCLPRRQGFYDALSKVGGAGVVVLYARRDDPSKPSERVPRAMFEGRGMHFVAEDGQVSARHRERGQPTVYWYDCHAAFAEDLVPKPKADRQSPRPKNTKAASIQRSINTNDNVNRVREAASELEKKFGKTSWRRRPMKGSAGRAAEIRKLLGEEHPDPVSGEMKANKNFSDETIDRHLKGL